MITSAILSKMRFSSLIYFIYLENCAQAGRNSNDKAQFNYIYQTHRGINGLL